jgi:hypothetical protein
MYPVRVPVNITNNASQVLNTMLSSLSLRILHGNCDCQIQWRFTAHSILSISRSGSLEQFFHSAALLFHGNDEQGGILCQKLKNIIDIELSIEAEDLHLQIECEDLAKASSDVFGLGYVLLYRINRQRQLPVTGSNVERGIRVKFIRRLLTLASANRGFVLIRGLSVVRIVRVIDGELIRFSGLRTWCIPLARITGLENYRIFLF